MDQENFYEDRPWTQTYDPGVRADLGHLAYHNLGEWIRTTCVRYAGNPALTDLDAGFRRVRFHELDRLSDQVMAYLRLHRDLVPGERVTVCLPAGTAWWVLALGCFKAGCVFVPLPPDIDRDSLQQRLEQQPSKVLITTRAGYWRTRRLNRDITGEHLIATPGTLRSRLRRFLRKLCLLDGLSGWIPGLDLDRAIKRGSRYLKHPAINDLAQIPGSVPALGLWQDGNFHCLSHGQTLSHLAQLDAVLGTVFRMGADVVACQRPPASHAGLWLGMMLCFQRGNHSVFVPGGQSLTSLRQIAPSKLITTSEALARVLRHPPKASALLNLTLLDDVPPSAEVRSQWQNQIKTPLVCLPPTWHGVWLSFPPIRADAPADSIGLPLPSMSVRIEAENGELTPANTEGNLLVRGPQCQSSPEIASWLDTGWRARMDAQGFLRIAATSENEEAGEA